MDTRSYIENLSEFADYLRFKGLNIGLTEVSDALTLLSKSELTDRDHVKMILRAVFAKSVYEVTIFDECFDGYFVSVEQRIANKQKAMQDAIELEQKKRQAEEELTLNGQPMDFTEEERTAYYHMDEDEKQKLRDLVQRSQLGLDRNPELYGEIIHSIFARSIMEQQMAMEDAAYGVSEIKDDPELNLMLKEISTFKDNDIRMATALITKITQNMNNQFMQKKSRRASSGKLDFKRTIRKGLSTGGVFYKLAYKNNHSRKKRLVLLLDVSASMLQFSEFALNFIQSLSSVSDFSRTFIFSEGFREVDVFTMQTSEGFKGYVKNCGLFGKGTDLGGAIEGIMKIRPSVFTGSTTFMVLSDTKTVNIKKAQAMLIEASNNCHNIVWLNPIPERKWKYLNTIAQIEPLVQMLPCSTLDELAKAAKKIMRD